MSDFRDQEPTGDLAIARRGVAALELACALPDGAKPDLAQRPVLAGWAGWGPLAKTLGLQGGAPGSWGDLCARVNKAVGYEQRNTARNACDTAFYTPATVARAMWDLATGLGFDGGKVLEPGCGSLRFATFAPPGLDVEWTGVEADKVSAHIAALLHPDAKVICERLEKTSLRYGGQDLAIGNVPFSAQGVYDPNQPKGITSLHGYFLWRALGAVRPGGLVIMVTSRWTLDSAGVDERAELCKLGVFAGAIRLPDSALAPGGTRAVTDIVVFRRRFNAGETWETDWLLPSDDLLDTTVSQYYVRHPEMVCGTMAPRHGQRQGMTLAVALDDGADLAAELDGRVQHLIWTARQAGLAYHPRTGLDDPVPDGVDPAMEGHYELRGDGTCTVQRNGQILDVQPQPELLSLIRLRDLATALFAAEADEAMGANERNRLRQATLRGYQEYVASFGYLSRGDLKTVPDPDTPGESMLVREYNPVRRVFRHDPDWPTLLAIEVWSDDDQEGHPAPILLRHVGGRPKRKTRTDDAGEALLLCLDSEGQVDLDVIGRLLGCDRADVPGLLGDLAWQDPETGQWVTADEYLSGNVRVKLTAAKAAGDGFAGHVAALEAVQPEDLGPDDINVQLGAPWLPPEVVEQFAAHLLGIDWDRSEWMGQKIKVRYEPYTSTWEVKGDVEARRRPAATATWGTTRRNAVNLVEDACNGTTPTISDEIETPDGKKMVKNREETALCADRIRDMQENFAGWVWEDPKRADRLGRIYNDRFNAVKVRTFDGSFLTFPGMAAGWEPYKHQRDMVYRNLCTPATLCGHVVGAGKAQPMDALILTPAGFRRMGDLMVGDEVIAVDGKPTSITGVFPQGPKDVYRVTFSDGATVECNDEHLWEVTTSAGRSQGLRSRVFTLRQLIDRGLRDSRGNRRWAVPIADAAEFDNGQPRPVDSYLLGLLLGDGCMTHGSVNFTTADDELRQSVQALLPDGCELISENDSRRPHDYRIRTGQSRTPGSSQFIDHLYSLGVMGMNARYKHVPQAYKEAPADVRLAVLQGLMDTDGTVSHTGAGEFSSSSRRLADDVAWLARSLGGTAKLRENRPAARPGSVYYDVTVAVPVNPFRLTRKASLWRPRTKYPPLRMIDTVERVGIKPMQCIAVDHPRHLYVTDDFVVTHNTWSAVATAMKLRELGLAGKPCIAVPNHLLEATCAETRRYFPAARILMVTREDLTPDRRKYFAAKCAARDWDLIVVTHQQFTSLNVSADLQAEYYAAQLDELDVAMEGDAAQESRSTAKMIARKRKRLIARLDALADLRRDGGVTFEQTRIDYLIIDESHMFKNLEYTARAEGFSTAGSKRADDLMMKLTHLRAVRPGGHVGMLMTGTPVSNSLAELWILFKYCAPHLLEEQRLVAFDAFAGQYIRYQTLTEVAPDGGGFRQHRRPRLFVNLPELRQMLWQFADIKARKDLTLDGPEVVSEHVVVDAPQELLDFTATLVERADAIRAGKVKPAEDNMLKVCGEGRAAALWLSLVGIESGSPGKIEACAANVARIYHETCGKVYDDRDGTALFDPRPGMLQVIFCDHGTPDSWDYGVYHLLRDLLVKAGVPSRKISFIHEARNHEEKTALFSRCRNGDVAVLIASTEKAGTGVNIQRRLGAIHHLSHPWRPADVEQRNGRGDRPGNGNRRLLVYKYATKGSFDAYTLQGLERKARFIAQILTGDAHVREAEVVDSEQVLSYAELKALATGQPLLLMLSEVNAEIAKLRIGQAGHKRARIRMQLDHRLAEEAAAEAAGIAAAMAAVARKAEAAGDARRLSPDLGRACTGYEDAATELERLLHAAREYRHDDIGRVAWRGVYFTIELSRQKSGPPLLYGFTAANSWDLDGRVRFKSAHRFPLTGRLWTADAQQGKSVLEQIDTQLDRAAQLAADHGERRARLVKQAEDMAPYLAEEWDGKDQLAAALTRRADLEKEIDAQVTDSRKVPQPV